jgi:hypothetical protein
MQNPNLHADQEQNPSAAIPIQLGKKLLHSRMEVQF